MKNVFQFFICSLIVQCFFLNSAFANCNLDNTTNPSGTRIATAGNTITFGQTFKACEDGELKKITVNTSGGNLQLFLMEGDGSTIDLTKPFQTFSALPAGDVVLELAKPFLVKENQLYAFAINGTSDVLFDWAPVADGTDAFRTIGGIFTPQPNSDLYFFITINTVIIPALNEWGLILLILIISNLSIFYLRELSDVVVVN